MDSKTHPQSTPDSAGSQFLVSGHMNAHRQAPKSSAWSRSSGAKPAGPDLARLFEDLKKSRHEAGGRQSLWRAITESLRVLPAIDLIAWYSASATGVGEEAACEVFQAGRLANAVADKELQAAARACQSGQATVCPHPESERCVVAIPLADNRQCLLTTFNVSAVQQASLGALQLAVAQIEIWEAQQVRREREAEGEQLAALLELAGRIESSAGFERGCDALANGLQQYLKCKQVVVGVCDKGIQQRQPRKLARGKRDRGQAQAQAASNLRCSVKALSGCNAFDPSAAQTVMAQAALQESVSRGELGVWPAVSSRNRQALLAHRQYLAAVQEDAIVSAPLRDATGRICGALLVVTESTESVDARLLNFLHCAESPLGNSLGLLARAEKGRLHQACLNAFRWLTARKGISAACISLALLLLLALPISYRPECDCRLEPVNRRFVATPFDGPLQQALVRPGQVVQENQLLARMDGREIRWKLAGAKAELHRAERAHAGHLALHEFGKAQLAKHEIERVRQEIALLEHRMTNLEIRSPISGVVVSGDLDDSVGVPLRVGETMFEVALLDEMNVELGVGEDDVQSVQVGMPVEVSLEAYPFRRFAGVVDRVHPRSELHDDQNVFVAEVRLSNPQNLLRPGMRGQARVTSSRRPIGWILFRRPYAAALRWLGW